MTKRTVAVAAVAVLALAGVARAVAPTAGELARRQAWVRARLTDTDPAKAVFSFQYGGADPRRAMGGWDRSASETADGGRVRREAVWTDRRTGLRVMCRSVEYRDWPVVEWVVWLKNTGGKDTPVVEGLRGVDLELEVGRGVVLHHNAGSPCTATDYRPMADVLKEGDVKRISAAGGRSTNSDLPFFNLEGEGHGGVIVGLGWPGQWAAEFKKVRAGVRVVGGQELTHFVLHPGEEVRTPLVAVLWYAGDVDRGQNLWRGWMVAENLPRGKDGRVPGPMTGACSSHQFGEMIHADEGSQKVFIDRYLEEGIKLDYWWMDAGWYVNNGGWPNTGTWEVDRTRFPRGLRAITDHGHERGVKSIVWFEPERVNPGTWLYEKHPEWLLGADGGNKLLNLGNDEARTWWVDRADKLVTGQGIDLYRTDFNIDPLGYWRGNDAADRQGVTENKYVVGLLAYWDELRRRHPGMLIDTCASGGRRNDLEVLRRAVPLLRSDYILEPVGQQNHTYGIAAWIPYYGTGVNSADPYVYRSQMCPWQTMCFDVRNRGLDYAGIRKLWAESKEVEGCAALGDYYPLTAYDPGAEVWMAWEFNLRKEGRGVVQAFRRAECGEAELRVRLKGLEAGAEYEVRDLDREGVEVRTGKELMGNGLVIRREAKPAAVVVTYRKKG